MTSHLTWFSFFKCFWVVRTTSRGRQRLQVLGGLWSTEETCCDHLVVTSHIYCIKPVTRRDVPFKKVDFIVHSINSHICDEDPRFYMTVYSKRTWEDWGTDFATFVQQRATNIVNLLTGCLCCCSAWHSPKWNYR